MALNMALQTLREGDRTTLFLLGDSIWLIRKKLAHGKGPFSDIESFLSQGGKVVVSGEHLQASGLSQEELLPQAEVAWDTYDRLVDLVMENWDKVVII